MMNTQLLSSEFRKSLLAIVALGMSSFALGANNVNIQTKTVFSTDFSAMTSVPTELSTQNDYVGTILMDAKGAVVAKTSDNSNLNNKAQADCIIPVRDYYMSVNQGDANYIKIGPIKKMKSLSFTQANTGNSRGFIVSVQGVGEVDETPVLTQYINKYSSGNANGTLHVLDLANSQTLDTNGTDLTQATSTPFSFTDAQKEEVYVIFRNYAGCNKASFMFSLSIDAEVTITTEQVTLDVAPADIVAGTVKVSPNGTSFSKGTTLELEATANFGYRFDKWIAEDGAEVSTKNPYSFAINVNTILRAVFVPVKTYTFVTRCTNNLEMANIGSIVLTPQPTHGMYEEGTKVTLTAKELPIFKFARWTDGGENANVTTATRELTISADTEIVADYEVQDFIAGFNSDCFPGYATSITYPFIPDYSYDNKRNATLCCINLASGEVLSGVASGTPVVRMRPDCISANMGGIFINGYVSNEIGIQTKFSTVGYTNAKYTAELASKNAAATTWSVQYSIDGTIFKPVLIDGANLSYVLTAGTYSPVKFDLPTDAIGKETVFIRFIGGTEVHSSSISVTTNSETGLAKIYIMGTPVVETDKIAPEIRTITPAKDAVGVSANGKITLSYNERIQAGIGEATLKTANGKVMLLEAEYGSSSVSFKYNELEYATIYTLTVPKGYVTDRSGNDALALESSFTIMERIKPQTHIFNAVVDGSLKQTVGPLGDKIGYYKTIQEAVNAAPADCTQPWLIFIKAGYYNDKNNLSFPNGKYDWNVEGSADASEDSRIVLVNKPFIHFIGEDIEKVTIAQNRVSGSNEADKNQSWYNVAEGATLVVTANDFYCENITLDNEWWTKYTGSDARGPQALALYVEADRATFNNCRIRSYQDTYLSPKTKNKNNGNNDIPHYYDRNYFNNCTIEGAVDFIYGGGDVYFDNCTLNIVRENGGYIVAPCHYSIATGGDTRWGYVFRNTTITAPKGKEATTQVYFGRPWQNAPRTVFIDTECRVKTYDGLWYPKMGAIPHTWAVYNMWNANKYPMSTESIKDYYYTNDAGETIKGVAKNSLTDAEAATYTLTNVFAGDGTDANIGRWNPAPFVEKTVSPVVNGENGSTVFSWTGDEYAICYVVTINGKASDFVTTTSYEKANLNDVVSVQSVNEYGALSNPSAAFTVGAGSATFIDSGNEVSNISVIGGKGIISIRNLEVDAQIDVYACSGALVEKLNVNHNVTFGIDSGNYIVKILDKSYKVVVR